MLDEGHPMTTETSMLKEIVLPPTLMGKLLNAAGVTGYIIYLALQLSQVTGIRGSSATNAHVQLAKLRLGSLLRPYTLASPKRPSCQ